MSEKEANTNRTAGYALVDSGGYAGIEKRQFYYSIPESTDVSVGDIFKIQFGKKNPLGIVRKTVLKKPMNIKGIKPLGAKLVLPTNLPSYYLDLADWLSEYYVSSSKSVWSCLLPGGIASASRIKPSKPRKTKLSKINKLSNDQVRALKTINNSTTTLLHGITGSGKTEVYLHAIARCIEQSQSSILLVPEIMLTTQLKSRLEEHFENVVTMHSGLSIATRKKFWLECLKRSKNESLVIIGARSALFTPLHNLGLIIIDEEHEQSYKQESSPRYDSVTVAAKLAKMTNSKLILGSATPSLRSFYLHTKNIIGYSELKNRHESELPAIEIIDIKKEKNTMISKRLKEEIDNSLKNDLQVLLFLNRRGSARALICNSCAQAVKCTNCNISLNYHDDINRLVCHYCNTKEMPPIKCSFCSSSDMKFVGDGTKKLEAEVKSTWPDAKVARIDRDNSKFEYLQKTYKNFASGSVDIVIGTQMISRGMDIDKLHLVGIVDADSAMQIPDFVSSERAFSQICQAAGRAGRRSLKGKVIIQTRNSDNKIIQTAARQNYMEFYKSEIASRKKFIYPPYCYLLKLQYAHKEPKKALSQARSLIDELSKTSKITILGPTEHFRRTLDKKTVYQIIVKSLDRKILQGIVIKLPGGWTTDLDPVSLM